MRTPTSGGMPASAPRKRISRTRRESPQGSRSERSGVPVHAAVLTAPSPHCSPGAGGRRNERPFPAHSSVTVAVRAGSSRRSATAPRSAVFVAISRSADEADAREIEAIDLTAGTRDLFDAGGRITAMALSPDRRSLYVGLDGGRVTFLDATTGIEFGDVDLGG